MTKEGFRCPHCGKVHGEYVHWEGARSPMCMKCRKLVPKDLVPEEYIQHRAKKGGKERGKDVAGKREEGREVKREEKREEEKIEEELKKKKEDLRKREENLRKEEEELVKTKEERVGGKKASLFITPRNPDEILEGVLREFNCDEVFIKAMVRRSQRIGGIHPGDLRNYISSMKSGIKSPHHAAYIADEYGFALDEERDKARKARETDYKTAYPVERKRGYERYERPGRGRKRDYFPRYPEEGYDRSQREGYRGRRERGEGVSTQDVRDIVEDTFDRREQKREREGILRSLGNRMTRMESDVANVPSLLKEGISEALEKRKVAEKPEITKADMNNMMNNMALNFEKKYSNLEKKYLERDFKRSTNESREREKEFQKDIQGLLKERNELSRKLIARRPTDLSGYQSDHYRMVGEAMSGLKDVIETRQPIKIAIEGIPKLLYPRPEDLTRKRTPELKEAKTIGGGVSRFVDKDYVEETEK